MTLKEFIAEIKTSLSNYDAMGLLDDISIYKWVMKAVKVFGANIMELQDTIIPITNGQGRLPLNFYSMLSAYLCEPYGYYTDKKDKKILQNLRMWVEKDERGFEWNLCNACTKNTSEKIITEKVYLDDNLFEVYYKNPVLLKLGRGFKRNVCHSYCKNKTSINSSYEITINNQTIHTNFKQGTIYMQYFGLPRDEKGIIILPESNNGYVEEYIEYFVKMKIFEKVLTNGDDPSASNLFQYYIAKENEYKTLALTDAKFGRLTPNSYKRLQQSNRMDMLVYELMFPNI